MPVCSRRRPHPHSIGDPPYHASGCCHDCPFGIVHLRIEEPIPPQFGKACVTAVDGLQYWNAIHHDEMSDCSWITHGCAKRHIASAVVTGDGELTSAEVVHQLNTGSCLSSLGHIAMIGTISRCETGRSHADSGKPRYRRQLKEAVPGCVRSRVTINRNSGGLDPQNRTCRQASQGLKVASVNPSTIGFFRSGRKISMPDAGGGTLTLVFLFASFLSSFGFAVFLHQLLRLPGRHVCLLREAKCLFIREAIVFSWGIGHSWLVRCSDEQAL